MNTRHSKLATKQLYKIHEIYHNEDGNAYINKGTDYEITEQPIRQKQQTLIQHIEEVIYADLDRCQWYNPQLPSNWTPPDPIYV